MDANGVPKESANAYQAYLDYRDLGSGRSLQKLVEKRRQSGGKTTVRLRTLEEWSSRFNWQERVKQYLAEEAAERAETRRKQREEMEDRHAKEAKEEQEIAREFIKTGAEEYHTISLPAVHLLKNSREDERKALGADNTQSIGLEVKTEDDNVQVIVYYPQSRENSV